MADITNNPTGTDIKKHVQDALDERESKNAFGVSLIPFHTHNGTDSPLIDDNANSIPTLPVSIANGGTGQITQQTAIDALLPSETANSGKFLTTNGTTASWEAIPQPYTFLGDGSDGAVTFDGTTTVLGIVPSGSIYTMAKDIFCTSITINSGVTLKSSNYRIFCTGTLTNNGTINNSGNVGTAGGAGGTTTGNNQQGAGGPAGSGGAGVAAGSLPAIPAGGAGAVGQTGGTQAGGGTPGNGSNVSNSFATTAKNATVSGAGGNGGGVGVPASGGGSAGTAGVVSSHSSSNVHLLQTFLNLFDANGQLGSIPSSGGGGIGGGGVSNTSLNYTSAGGGGGSGGAASPGGQLMIYALTITIGASGVISSNGANGGNGGAGGGASGGVSNPAGGGGGAGAGSNGGIIGLIYHTLTNNGSITVTAGTGGTGGAFGSGFGTPVAGGNGQNGVAGLIYQLQF
jgi:hypothetical protein